MTPIFVDTSAFYAAADRSDRHHAIAAATFTARGTSGDLTTTDHVIVETWCLMNARLGRACAMRFWDALSGGVVKVLGVGSADLQRARRIVRDFPDQPFSLVDCTSFAVMERLGIGDAFAFDSHFRVFRHGPRHGRAFRVLP